MSSSESHQSVFAAPAMSIEGDANLLAEARPIRLTGFLALGLGLLSFTAVLGAPMMFLPVLAVIAALIALRPYGEKRPTGMLPASIGLFAAVLFGFWGATERHLRDRMMTEHATRFASQWLELLAQGDVELAMELQSYPNQRQSASMSLVEYYRDSEKGQARMQEFRENETLVELLDAGSKVDWKVAREPKFYTMNRRFLTATIWADESQTVKSLIKVVLEYLPAADDEPAEWVVDSLTTFVEPSGRG